MYDQTTIRNSLSVAVEPGATNGVNVPCDPNEIITGGGFSANSDNGNIQVIDSASFEGGWNVDVLNNGLVSESSIGYAVCLRLVP